MEKCKVIVEDGVMFLTYNGEKLPAQVSLKLEDNSEIGCLPLATVSFHVDLIESIPKKEIDYKAALQEYKDHTDKLKAEREYLKETIKVYEEKQVMSEKEVSTVKKVLKYCFR